MWRREYGMDDLNVIVPHLVIMAAILKYLFADLILGYGCLSKAV